ncbi:hypothetical protein LTR86_000527 [Recurvomyces mirabilis]|nr:hypothetical protein LTR86_000527 [Recurvomyces mirabilis]
MVHLKVLGAGLCLLAVTSLAAPPAGSGINAAGKRPAQDYESILPKRPKSEAFTEAVKANEEQYMLLDEPQSPFINPAELQKNGWAVNTDQSRDSLDIDSLVAGLHGEGVSTARNQYTWKQIVRGGSGMSKANPLALDSPNDDCSYASYTQWLDVQQGVMIVDAADLGQGHQITAHQASTQPLQDHTPQLWEWQDVAYLLWAEACAQHRRHASTMSWLIFLNIKSASTLIVLQDIFGPHLENLLSGPGMQFSVTEEGGEALLGSEIGLLARRFLSSHRQEFGQSNIVSVKVFSADGPVMDLKHPVMAFYITRTANPGLWTGSVDAGSAAHRSALDLARLADSGWRTLQASADKVFDECITHAFQLLGFATDYHANVLRSEVQSGWGANNNDLQTTINRDGTVWHATEAKYRVVINRRDGVIVATLIVIPEQAAALKPNSANPIHQDTLPTISQWPDYAYKIWRSSTQPPSSLWRPHWLFFPVIFDAETLKLLDYDPKAPPIGFPGDIFDAFSETGQLLLGTPLGRQAIDLISNMQDAHSSVRGSIDGIHVYSIRRNWRSVTRATIGKETPLLTTRPCVAMHIKWE